jgi:Pyruvate/2-oxoacid:ferredoxin oxidoreductase delta subunit
MTSESKYRVVNEGLKDIMLEKTRSIVNVLRHLRNGVGQQLVIYRAKDCYALAFMNGDKYTVWSRTFFWPLEAVDELVRLRIEDDDFSWHAECALGTLRAVPASERTAEVLGPWIHRSKNMRCRTCMYFCPKAGTKKGVGRCRRHAPTMSGYPVVFETDWCGDHKLNETVK